MKKIIWENFYNDLPVHAASALRNARLQPDQVIAKTDGELMAIEGIKEEDVNSIRAIYNAESVEKIKQVAAKETETQVAEIVAETKVKKVIKPRQHSKKYNQMAKGLDRETTHEIKDAVEILSKLAKSSKLKTVELTLNTRENGVRGEIKLPHSTGKEVRIAIFNPEVEAKITAGTFDFDMLLATPADMPKLAKFAKALGPKGLMPNPRNGTVTDNPEKRAKELAAGGTLPYKTESKSPIIHLALGPITQNEQDLIDNITETLRSIGSTKIKSAFLSCTHTPSVRLNLSSI
jgi:large subunit ribosomal protein L1